jgi:dTMP kinase
LGEAVRELVLHRSEWSIDADSEMLLFMAARCQLVREIIRPALAQNRWVLCDRFQMSTVVYQGHAGKVDAESIRRIGAFATAGLVPDLVLVFDLDPAIAAQRMGRELDRMEARGCEFLAAVRDGFLREAQRGGESVFLIAADRPADEIAATVAARLRSRFAQQLAQKG